MYGVIRSSKLIIQNKHRYILYKLHMCAQVQAPCDSVGPADAKRLTQQHVYFLAALLIYACVTHLISRELPLARIAWMVRRAIQDLAHTLEGSLQLLVFFLQCLHPISENTLVIQAIRCVCEIHVQSMLSVTIPSKVR